MTVDYYFAFLILTYQIALNKAEFNDATQIEDLLQKLVEMNKRNEEIGVVWLMKIQRLVKTKSFNEAHTNIIEFIKFCN